MTQGFDDAFKKISKVNLKTHTELWGEPKTEKLYFEAGAASRQAEIDELKKRLDVYERECYKLVPVEPTIDMIKAYYSTPKPTADRCYKAMIGAVE